MKKMSLFLLSMIVLFAGCGSAAGEEALPFSSLPTLQKYRIRQMVAPPEPHQRYGCYSTPAPVFFEGREFKGNADSDPDKRVYPKMKGKKGPDYGYWKLKRNRTDWQDVLMRNWAELGFNNTHCSIFPGKKGLQFTPSFRKAIESYAQISARHGIKVGVRLDAVGGTKAWEMNPDNPDNVIKEYLVWAKEVAGILKGKTAYYVLGDEMTLHKAQPGLSPRKWTPEKYLKYFRQVSTAIKQVDPQAKVSMFGTSSGEWFNVLYLLEIGYAQYGDGVAINYYNYRDIPKFFDDARRLAPDLMFLSNGVGYCSCGPVQPRYPQGDPYHKYPTEEKHAAAVAKNMFAWWDLEADTAPYYVTIRNFVFDGVVKPYWYGFFGFEDIVIDKYGNATIKRYPGWYAFQTVAHTFYNRDDFKKPAFDVTSSADLSMFRTYEHKLTGGSELVIMLWNDKGKINTTVKIADAAYQYPVRIFLFNYHEWSDVPYQIEDNTVKMDLEVGAEPLIIRLVRSH